MEASFLNAIPIPSVLVGADERLRKLNAPAERLFGPSLTGRHYITGLRQPALLDAVETALRLGRPAEAIFLSSEASREMTWRATAAPVRLELGGQGVLVTFLDTTPMREADQMRRDFVANVSHELRTPLTALLGFIETLKGAARDDAAARERFLGIMEREAERMNRLVKDLLSLSRVEEAERMRPTDPVDITALVASVALTLAPMARTQDVTLRVEGLPEPVDVPGDEDQLLQVLTNLLENAIKYSGAGASVTVSLARSDHDVVLRAPSVTISVVDTGEGIDPVHIPRLTERFYRVDSHRSRELGGTGLGLAIVKHIVNRHRGRMRIESEPGKGSAFTVILPLAASAGPGAPGASVGPVRPDAAAGT
ncbi:sensor histidine kinase [Palleronia sp. KMU-117]|uniref:sensor histidine kinase n=1 Tax=Palleronia sp. KMU-117 TaxID=3434108 RepID=UPI003D708C9C